MSSQPLGDQESFYNIHPIVTETALAEIGAHIRATVDEQLGAFWVGLFKQGLDYEMQRGGELIVRAGCSALPYPLRQKNWQLATFLLERVVALDSSPATLAVLLPRLRQVAAAQKGTQLELEADGILAKALIQAGRLSEAEAILQDVLRRAVARRAFRVASATMTDIMDLLRETGRAEKALGLVDELRSYTRDARLGPWTQLSDEASRLRILIALARYEEVLTAVEGLLETMRTLPERSQHEEATSPWRVRRSIMEVGRDAARYARRWEKALAFNAEIIAITTNVGSPPHVLAQARFNDYEPLLGLRRYEEAFTLLQECREVFEREGDVSRLGKVFSGLAFLEDRLGHRDAAIALQKTALRFVYQSGDPYACSVDHFNLANYLMRAGQAPDEALAHRLAAGLIDFQSHSDLCASTRRDLTRHIARFAPDAPPIPRSFDDLCRTVEAVEGVMFREPLNDSLAELLTAKTPCVRFLNRRSLLGMTKR